METSLILIRHAETQWNSESRMQGFKDSPLTPRGVDQAEKLGLRLRRRPFHAVYSSDSGRCRETARIALGTSGHTLETTEVWRERNLGAWEGLTWKDIGEPSAGNYRRDPAFSPPGGESWHALQNRAVAAIENILQKHPGKRIAVFTSGGTLRAAVFGIMKLPPELWATWATWNTGISRLDHRAGTWKLIKYNDVGHLS